MSVQFRALAILLLCGCAQPSSSGAPAPAPTPVEPPPVAAAAPGTGSGSGGPDAQALYEGCRERVEGTESDGECASDADCARTGCSAELCVAKKGAEGVVSTCEARPCFQVLEACACRSGRCRWVVGKSPIAIPGGEGGTDVR
jgi:eight-cysteine-cluster-containing protein